MVLNYQNSFNSHLTRLKLLPLVSKFNFTLRQHNFLHNMFLRNLYKTKQAYFTYNKQHIPKSKIHLQKLLKLKRLMTQSISM